MIKNAVSAFFAIAAVALFSFAGMTTSALASEEWESIRSEYFGDREILDGKDVMFIEAPDKAEDAAIVPVEVFLFSRIGADVKKMTMFIDRNPAPLVAAVNFGEAAGDSSRKFSTRVRFDSYSILRAIIETKDGKLFMTSKFVIAAGGCSSSGVKDMETANKGIGKIRVKRFNKPGASQSFATAEAQVMVRHPNHSGMAMDPEKGEYIPAHYVDRIKVMRGKEMIFDVEAGISLSTNPAIRFTYSPGTGEPITVEASDSEGAKFKGASRKKVVSLEK